MLLSWCSLRECCPVREEDEGCAQPDPALLHPAVPPVQTKVRPNMMILPCSLPSYCFGFLRHLFPRFSSLLYCSNALPLIIPNFFFSLFLSVLCLSPWPRRALLMPFLDSSPPPKPSPSPVGFLLIRPVSSVAIQPLPCNPMSLQWNSCLLPCIQQGPFPTLSPVPWALQFGVFGLPLRP